MDDHRMGEQTGYRMRRGMGYFSNALKLALGAGVALGGGYLFSRIGEKQSTEASLSRLEQMLAELAGAEEQQPSKSTAGATKKVPKENPVGNE